MEKVTVTEIISRLIDSNNDMERRLQILEGVLRPAPLNQWPDYSGYTLHEKQLIDMREKDAMAQAVRDSIKFTDGSIEAQTALRIPHDFVSRRSDVEAITVMTDFLKRIVNMSDLGALVPATVRDAACRALDMP